MLAAFDIEKTYSKQQIFEMYANTIYFGSGYYGIAEAAEGYFGKEPAQLTDAEAIYLAGMPNAPSPTPAARSLPSSGCRWCSSGWSSAACSPSSRPMPLPQMLKT